MIFLFLSMLLLLLDIHVQQAQKPPLPSVSCTRDTTKPNDQRGNYIFSITTDTDVNPITCEVTAPQTCTSTSQSHGSPPSGGSNQLKFSFQLQMTKFQPNPVNIKFFTGSDSNKEEICQGNHITFPFDHNEKPRLTCDEQKSTQDLFTYHATCRAFFADTAHTLTKTGETGCQLSFSYTDAVQENQFSFSKIATLTFSLASRSCNTQCTVTISVPQGIANSNPAITKVYSFRFSCPEPNVNVAGHDVVEREISFIVDADYEYNKIEVHSKTTGVVISNPSLFDLNTEELRRTPQKFKYTVSNPSSSSQSFVIEFKIYQGGTSLIHTIEKTFSYTLLNEEKESIVCNQKTDAPPQKSASTVFDCTIKSKTTPITLEAEKLSDGDGTFTIDPSSNFGLDGGNQLKVKTRDITLTSQNAVCNQHHRVKIKFQSNPNMISVVVSHITQCPDPTITCSTNNLARREITCSIQIVFRFVTLNVRSSSSAVHVLPATISSADLTGSQSHNKIVKYTLKDLRKSTNNQFNLIFKVMQKNRHVAFEKTLGFEYVLQSDELAHIHCNLITNPAGVHYSSNTFTCAMMASMWNVTLKLKESDFEISPKFVTGQSHKEMYLHNQFNVFITPKTIICNDLKDVTIYFNDVANAEKTFKMKHKTKCPDPIIHCHAHYIKLRSITCEIKIPFPFKSVQLTMTGQATLKEGSEILLTEYSKVPSYEHMITYEVSDRASASHEFAIEFKVYQDSTKTQQAYSTTRRFEYVLSQEEIPSLSCNEKARETNQALDETKYKCRIISKTRPAEISLQDTTNYQVTATIPNLSSAVQGIIKIEDLDVTIKARRIICGKMSQVEIHFMDGADKHSFIVTHSTICPNSVVYCSSHDLVMTTIKCNFNINYKFTSITATLLPNHVKFENSQRERSISGEVDSFIRNDQEIKYKIDDYRITNHEFQLKISVQQPDTTKSFERSFWFKYVLTRDQSPHISCRLSNPDTTKKFDESKYQCKIISRMTNPKIKLETSDYTIQQTANGAEDFKNLQKQDAATFTVKPKRIICEKRSQLMIYFKDDDDKIYTDIISHLTKCPRVEVKDESQMTESRKFSWKLEAPFEFAIKSFKSSVSTVKIVHKAGSVAVTEGKWSVNVEVTYEPLDWSFNEHEFAVISTVTPSESSDISVMTNTKKFDLIPKEKPSISCEESKEKEELYFTEKVFVCTGLSRQSTLELRVLENRFQIVEQVGKHKKDKNVYHWTDFKVKIRDLSIKCGVNTDLTISFSEYTENIKTKIQSRTNCPDAEISCIKNDQVRNIECLVDAKFPHTEVDVSSQGNIKLLKSENSNIVNVGRSWKSKHTIPYELTDLKNSNHEFALSLTVFQDSLLVTTKRITFEYILRDSEKPQITCIPRDFKESNKFAETRYSCYIVAVEEKFNLLLLPKHYRLHYNFKAGTNFLGLHKWENFQVVVKDQQLICNKTSEISIKVEDGDNKRETTLQHTTVCPEIEGECEIFNKESIFIFCNFTSEMNFQLKEYQCSEYMNCSKLEDLKKVSEKYHEYMFNVAPHIYQSVIEFTFNITLSYSEHSDVKSSYTLEYVTLNSESENDKPVQTSAAAINMFSYSVLVYPVCLIVVVLVYRYTKNTHTKNHGTK